MLLSQLYVENFGGADASWDIFKVKNFVGKEGKPLISGHDCIALSTSCNSLQRRSKSEQMRRSLHSSCICPAQCWNGELPSLEAAEQYRGIFITGSHFSAYEELAWIDSLMTWLHNFLQREHSTRIVAVCFGCQVGVQWLVRTISWPVQRLAVHRSWHL